MKAFSLALLLLSGFFHEAGAGAAMPSCRDQWRGQNARFDFRESYDSYRERLHREACEKDWTVLVYMAADNNLFPYALWNLFEMEAAFESRNAAGSTAKTDLVVQVDGPANDDLRRLHVISGPVKYEQKTKDDFASSTLDMIRSPVVEKLPENDGKSEQRRLEEFLSWAAARYPSRHYMVVVWGHGQGWKSYPVENPAPTQLLRDAPAPFAKPAPDKSFGGIAFRQSAGSWLDIPALSAALGAFESEIGRPVDVYASDACLMQMLEVAYEIGRHARFVVGSAQVQSFLGLPYRRILYELNTGHFDGLRAGVADSVDSADEPYLLAKMIPTLMKATLNPRGGGLHSGPDKEAILSMTSSALTLGELETTLVPGLSRLGQALKAYLLEDKSRVMELRYVTQNVPALEGSAQDFGVFLGFLDQLLVEERAKGGGLTRAAEALRDEVANVKQALDRSVLSYAYGARYGVDGTSSRVGYVPRAVSLWLPVSPAEFAQRRAEFAASRLYRDTGWQGWLDLVYR